MKVISFVATKSSGKSTSIHVLAERLLSEGVNVHIIDCDPQADQLEFVHVASKYYENLTFTPWSELKNQNHIPTTVFDIVDDLAGKDGVLIIDVQGSDNDLLSLGAIVSDLVLVPMMDGNLEHKSTNQTLTRLAFLERTRKQRLPIRTFWAKAPVGINLSNAATGIQKGAEEAGYQWLGSNLLQRKEFKNLVLTGKILQEDAKPSEQQRQKRSEEIADHWKSKIVEMFA